MAEVRKTAGEFNVPASILDDIAHMNRLFAEDLARQQRIMAGTATPEDHEVVRQAKQRREEREAQARADAITVGDLIDMLSRMPQDLPVRVMDSEDPDWLCHIEVEDDHVTLW